MEAATLKVTTVTRREGQAFSAYRLWPEGSGPTFWGWSQRANRSRRCCTRPLNGGFDASFPRKVSFELVRKVLGDAWGDGPDGVAGMEGLRGEPSASDEGEELLLDVGGSLGAADGAGSMGELTQGEGWAGVFENGTADLAVVLDEAVVEGVVEDGRVGEDEVADDAVGGFGDGDWDEVGHAGMALGDIAGLQEHGEDEQGSRLLAAKRTKGVVCGEGACGLVLKLEVDFSSLVAEQEYRLGQDSCDVLEEFSVGLGDDGRVWEILPGAGIAHDDRQKALEEAVGVETADLFEAFWLDGGQDCGGKVSDGAAALNAVLAVRPAAVGKDPDGSLSGGAPAAARVLVHGADPAGHFVGNESAAAILLGEQLDKASEVALVTTRWRGSRMVSGSCPAASASLTAFL
jgi:hypothetical protein